MDALIDETERTLVEIQPDREATFAEAVAEWREWAEHTKRLQAGDAAQLRRDAVAARRATAQGRAAGGADHARVRRPADR